MDLGEKLQILKEIIYKNAKKELNESETPLSIQVLIIDAVTSKIKEEAYKESIIRAIQNEQATETQTGTPEELLKEMKGEAET